MQRNPISEDQKNKPLDTNTCRKLLILLGDEVFVFQIGSGEADNTTISHHKKMMRRGRLELREEDRRRIQGWTPGIREEDMRRIQGGKKRHR
ncbi:hypothetical protein M5689_011568 [Euphorbia peplus]|nr:hypothetical protein M5689_011568 [Euphorbia peplus]